MAGYGQFCPVAIASEVITERWTLLVIRELTAGSRRFNELRRGLPLMSPSLLSKRLKALERTGLVDRIETSDGRGVEYRLTQGGRDLQPIIESIGQWGMRWVRGHDLRDEDLDASLLMWDMRRSIAEENLPERRVVTHFHLRGSTDGRSHYWLVIDRPEVDLCLIDPGHRADVEVVGHVATLVQIWLGDRTFTEAIRSGDLGVTGPPALVRSFPSWFSLSGFAGLQNA